MLLAIDVGNTETVIGCSGPRRPKRPTPWDSRARAASTSHASLAHLD